MKKLIFALGILAAVSANAGKDSEGGVPYEAVSPSYRSNLPNFNVDGQNNSYAGEDLLEVNDRRVRRAKEVEAILKDIKPGTIVKYKVKHNGKVEEQSKKFEEPIDGKSQPATKSE